MATTDRLTPELWQIKKEVDCHYMSNRLVSLPFPTAAWNLLAFAENEALKESFHPVTSQDISVIVDTLVNKLKAISSLEPSKFPIEVRAKITLPSRTSSIAHRIVLWNI